MKKKKELINNLEFEMGKMGIKERQKDRIRAGRELIGGTKMKTCGGH